MLPLLLQPCGHAKAAQRSHAAHARPSTCPRMVHECIRTGYVSPASMDRARSWSRQNLLRDVARSSTSESGSLQGQQGGSQRRQQADRVTDEINFQEREASLSIDDLVSMQYEVPSDEQLDVEVAELLEEEGLAASMTAAASRPTPVEAGAVIEDEDEEEATGARFTREGRVDAAVAGGKAALLMEILAAAGSGELDAKLVQFEDQIDEELLSLLQLRMDMAAKVDPEAASGLRELYTILRVVAARSAATPAERLLDEVLDMMGEDGDLGAPSYEMRRAQVVARLREAFTGGASLGLDIFAAAAALAEAGPLAAAELATEAVTPVAFLQEATELLAAVREAQDELQAGMAQALDRGMPPKELVRARAVYEERGRAMAQLQEVIMLARQLADGGAAPRA